MRTNFHSMLDDLVTRWDIRQSVKRGYNPNALAIYLRAAEDAAARHLAGDSIREALEDNFSDRLLDFLLKELDAE